jgi:hypothetical protein
LEHVEENQMAYVRALDDITLSPSEIRKQLIACQAREKLLREMLQIAEHAQRVQHALTADSERAGPLRRKNPAVVPMRPPNANGLRDAIRATRATTPRFTVDSLVERLRTFPFASDPHRSARDAVYVLVKRGELKVVGKDPNTYEWQTAAKIAREAASS